MTGLGLPAADVTGDQLQMPLLIGLFIATGAAVVFALYGRDGRARRSAEFVAATATVLYVTVDMQILRDLSQPTPHPDTMNQLVVYEMEKSWTWLSLAAIAAGVLLVLALRDHPRLSPERHSPPLERWQRRCLAGIRTAALLSSFAFASTELASRRLVLSTELTRVPLGLAGTCAITGGVAAVCWTSGRPSLVWMGQRASAFVAAVVSATLSALYGEYYAGAHRLTSNKTMGDHSPASRHIYALFEQTELVAMWLLVLLAFCWWYDYLRRRWAAATTTS